MKPVDVFFVRRFNDVDHIVPVVYRVAKNGQRAPLVLCLNPFLDISGDFRLRFLQKQWGVTVAYLYLFFAPTLFHKIVARVICSSYMRTSTRGLFRSGNAEDHLSKTGWRSKFRPKQLLAMIACGLIKKCFYGWIDRVLVRKILFNERWARAFLKEVKAASLVFDYIHANIHVAGALITAAQKLGIPLISLPHGTSLFWGRPLEGPSDDHARVINSGVEYFVAHHHRDADVLVGYGFDAKKLRVLGSARYCQEWEEVLHRIVPAEPIPGSNNPRNKLRVVYMERGADRHGAYKHLVWETLERIAGLDFVDFIIKPPTRTDRLHFTRLPESVVIADAINSVNLCRWADVVVGTVTSILLEVFWQRKILLYPKYFHDDYMWFEKMGASWTAHSPEELERALRQLKVDPSYRPYPQSAVDDFFAQTIYAGESDHDVLGRYSDFIAGTALNGSLMDAGVNPGQRIPGTERASNREAEAYNGKRSAVRSSNSTP